jgi:multidrug efflux system outer membrane protein
MIRSRTIAALFCASALTACAVEEPYVAPDVELPDGWRIDVADAAELVDTRWWESFQDPVLEALIDEALANNTDLTIAAARVEEFAAVVEAVASEGRPQVGYGADAGRGRTSDNGSFPGMTANLWRATISASWELDLFGKIRNATEAARAQLLSSEEARRTVVLSLVSSVATNYVTLRALDEQLLIAHSTLKARGESRDLFRIQFEGGIASELQLSQAESQYQETAADIPAIERQIGQLENAFSVLLGRNPGDIVRGRGLDELTPPAIPAGLPSDLLQRRPDVRGAEADLRAANAQVGVARSLYYPSIGLTGLLGLESQDLSDLLDSGSTIWSAGATVTGPIFTGGRLDAQLAQAEARRKALVAQYQRTLQVAFQEVEDALIGQRTGRAELAAQAARIVALETYFELARLRYDNGYSSYLEVLDAERALFAARLAQVQTEAETTISVILLYKAMGGGWVDQADQMASEVRTAAAEAAAAEMAEAAAAEADAAAAAEASAVKD